MPAAAVIPAPIAYIKVAAVKKLVVGSWIRTDGPPKASPLHHGTGPRTCRGSSVHPCARSWLPRGPGFACHALRQEDSCRVSRPRLGGLARPVGAPFGSGLQKPSASHGVLFTECPAWPTISL